MEKENFYYNEELKTLIRTPAIPSNHAENSFIQCKCIDLTNCEFKTNMMNRDIVTCLKPATQKQIILFKQLERTMQVLCKQFV